METQQESLLEALQSTLECPLCLNLLEKPITTSCGHSFCLKCLEKSLDYQNGCPVCRKPTVHKTFGKRATSVILEKAVDLLRRQQAPAAGSREGGIGNKSLPKVEGEENQDTNNNNSDEEKPSVSSAPSNATSDTAGTVGVFVLDKTFVAIPNQKFILNVFEPRYLLLLNRSLENDIPFAVQSGWERNNGLVVKVARIINPNPLVVECVVIDRYYATSPMRLEPDSFGLYCRDIQTIKDDVEVSQDERNACKALAEHLMTLVHQSFTRLSLNEQNYLHTIIGQIPVRTAQDLEDYNLISKFSFWLVGSIYWADVDSREQALASTNCLYRLQKVSDSIFASPNHHIRFARLVQNSDYTQQMLILAGLFAALVVWKLSNST